MKDIALGILKMPLVCMTKFRQKVLTVPGLDMIERSFREVARQMNCQRLAFNGEVDYVHTLVEYLPKLSVSQIGNTLKGVLSRRYGQAGLPKPYNKTALAVQAISP